METSGPARFINRNMGIGLRHGIIWGITEMGIGRLGLTNHSPSGSYGIIFHAVD